MVEQQTRNLREDLSRNIEAGQAEFEERVTRNLREDLSRNIEATRQDVEATCRDLEATRQDFEAQLAALKLEAAAWPTARTQEVNKEPTKTLHNTHISVSIYNSSWYEFHTQILKNILE
jgi:hypothetical protein